MEAKKNTRSARLVFRLLGYSARILIELLEDKEQQISRFNSVIHKNLIKIP